MPACCAPYCSTRNANHRFPKNPQILKKWLTAIKKENTELSPFSRLCKKHFRESDYEVLKSKGDEKPRPVLKKKAVPTQFLWSNQGEEVLQQLLQQTKKCNKTSGKRRRRNDVMLKMMEYNRKSGKTVDTLPYGLRKRDCKAMYNDSDDSDSMPKDVKERCEKTSTSHKQESSENIRFEEVSIKVETVTVDLDLEEDHNDLDSEYINNFHQLATDTETHIVTNVTSIECGSENLQIKCEVDVELEPWEPLQCNFPLGDGLMSQDAIQIEYFQDPSKQLEFQICTGFDNYKQFWLIFSLLGPAVNNFIFKHEKNSTAYKMRPEDQFLLTVIKLKLNMHNRDLAKKFFISEATVSKLFLTWINFLHSQFHDRNIWVPQEIDDGKCSDMVMIKCLEIKIEKPKNRNVDQLSRSSTDPWNTLKVLVGMSCKGTLTLVSNAYGGSIDNKSLFEQCGFENLLEKNKQIISDRGFDIRKLRSLKNVIVKIPGLLGTNPTTDLKPVNFGNTRKFHIENIIEFGNSYSILSGTFASNLVPLTSRIVFTCFMLINFKSHLPESLD